MLLGARPCANATFARLSSCSNVYKTSAVKISFQTKARSKLHVDIAFDQNSTPRLSLSRSLQHRSRKVSIELSNKNPFRHFRDNAHAQLLAVAEISCESFWEVSGVMKELKMFPQITEETEENLLHLEDEEEDPPKSPPPTYCHPSTPSKQNSTSSSDSPPNSPNDDTQPPCPLLTITNDDTDQPNTTTNHIVHQSTSLDEGCTTPPPTRVRMRSLSGGAYRLTPLPATGRMRRVSGDDVLTRVSPSRRSTIFEQFRPRSKSDSKGKRPTFLSNLKNTFFSGAQRKNSLETEPPLLEQLQPVGDYRQRSGSETRGGTMSKMIDLFRNRSNSLSTDSRGKKPSNSYVPTNSLLRRHSVDPDKRRRPCYNAYRSLDTHQGDSCHGEEDASGAAKTPNHLRKPKRSTDVTTG
ncbi:hypothetical protein JTE90_005983 [Oedothorax gibbosus]|uniref:Uncharacterized protein n=1 Tax=Oedothorax gibbosus TaxID=931172 RepID=A0AAV6UYN4_9ARAC|nr:hypothetical protein JTE90_005983 [Oedothorax gibbosus]